MKLFFSILVAGLVLGVFVIGLLVVIGFWRGKNVQGSGISVSDTSSFSFSTAA